LLAAFVFIDKKIAKKPETVPATTTEVKTEE
jgi:hypothetical protein